MRELLVETEHLPGEEESTPGFDYYITIDEMDVGRFSCESYGVKVRDRQTLFEQTVPHITVSAQRIDELMQILMRNTVTPTSLSDVVADWL